jgi:hypothetical protein
MNRVTRSLIVVFAACAARFGAAGCDVHVPLAVGHDPGEFPPPGGDGSGSNGTGVRPPDPPLPVPVQVLARGQDLPARVVLDEDYVYWVNIGTSQAGSVMRVAKAGGDPQLLANEPRFPVGLVVDDDAVYWTASGSYAGEGAVMRVTKGGGTPVVLATGLSWPSELAQDADSLYWRDELSGVERVTKRGGVPSVLVPGATLSSGLAVGRGRVYFEDFAAGTISSVATTGGPVTEIAAVPGIDIPFFVVDGDFVYWHIGSIGSVMQVPITGGTPSVLYPADDELRYFAVTPDAVYVTEMGEIPEMPPGPRAIHRITRSGDDKTQITPPGAGNWGVAVDAHNVYWTNLSTGTLNAVAR